MARSSLDHERGRRAIAFEEAQRIPPPPTWGRIEAGEASEDCRPPKRGFPLPNLMLGEGFSVHTLQMRLSCPRKEGTGAWSLQRQRLLQHLVIDVAAGADDHHAG